jgi:hypothetical protein
MVYGQAAGVVAGVLGSGWQDGCYFAGVGAGRAHVSGVAGQRIRASGGPDDVDNKATATAI